ncbi:MAG: MFS transporter [Jatrophihabitantaceae bacterium]
MPRPRHAAVQVGFSGVLRIREFGLLWVADAQSLLGDQLARVALSVLVYDRTGSGLATASVYALSFLPALLGSLLLGPLADRLPRRALLVGGDLIRAALLAVMALPHVPVPALAALLVAAVLVGAPWKAAESALVVDILAREDYVVGAGLRTATAQAMQLLGFALGGIAVAAVGVRPALALDAATFLVSALVIRIGVQARPPARRRDHGSVAPQRRHNGAATVLRDPRLRQLILLSWLLGILVVPEGLAAPYAHLIGGGARTVGVLLAALPAGVLVGSVVYSRWLSPASRAALVGPLAVVAGIPLVACASTPGLLVTLPCWALSGACTAYQIQVVTEFVQTISPEIRGQGISLASGGLLAAQGLGLVAGGAVAQFSSPGAAIAAAGAVATVLGAGLALARRRAHPQAPATGTSS